MIASSFFKIYYIWFINFKSQVVGYAYYFLVNPVSINFK